MAMQERWTQVCVLGYVHIKYYFNHRNACVKIKKREEAEGNRRPRPPLAQQLVVTESTHLGNKKRKKYN